MTFENLSMATAADAAAAPGKIGFGDNAVSALSRLQADAGLRDPASLKISDILPPAGDVLQPAVAGTDNTRSVTDNTSSVASAGSINDLQSLSTALTAPTDQQRADAEKALENRMSKLIPPADRAAMQAITTALLNGDHQALAAAIKNAARDPKKLQAILDEVDKLMEEKGCSTRLDLTDDGKVLISSSFNSTALALDPASGNFEAKSVEHMFDGSVRVEPGELLHVDKNKVFKDMADSAVRTIAPASGSSAGGNPFNPLPPGAVTPSSVAPSDHGRPSYPSQERPQPSYQPQDRPQPSYQPADHSDAGDDGPSELIPQGDRVSIFAIFAGLANGDARAFADALKKAGGDPEKMQELLDEVNKMLKKQKSSTRLDLSADGKVIISDTNSGTALSVDPASGKVEARAIEHKSDGAILIKPGEVVHVDTDKLFKDLGASLTVPKGK